MRFKSIIKFLLLVLILGALVWFLNRDKVNSLPVKEVKIENRVVTKTVASSGEVKAPLEADLSFTVGGRVLRINVEKGAKVTKGDLLANLDTQSLYQTSQAYREAVDVIKRDRDLYIENYDTNRNAVGGSDEYNAALRKYDEQINQAQATYQASLGSLRNAYIYAPFDGMVLDVTKEAGENAAATELVVKLASMGDLSFETDIDQEDYGQLQVGQSVELTLDAFGNTKFPGKIIELPLYAEGTTSKTFKVKISIQPSEGKTPLLGMTGDAKIEVASTSSEVPSLYYDEIYYDEQNNPYVWVIDNNLITRQGITIGMEGDIYTQVTSQIDKMIVTGINEDTELKEGFRASIVR